MKFKKLYESLVKEAKTSDIKQVSITTKDGKPLSQSKYKLNIPAKILKTRATNIVIDIGELEGWTFNTGSGCTFIAGNHCIFKTGSGCTFNVGDYCTFDVSTDCTIEAGDYCTVHNNNKGDVSLGNHCTVNSGGADNATYKTGKNCHLNIGSLCNLKTGASCWIEAKSSCTFKVGNSCTFGTGPWCIFNLGNKCELTVKNINTQTFNSYGKMNTIIDNMKKPARTYKLTDELVDKLEPNKIR